MRSLGLCSTRYKFIFYVENLINQSIDEKLSSLFINHPLLAMFVFERITYQLPS